jgi:hypothetical protein
MTHPDRPADIAFACDECERTTRDTAAAGWESIDPVPPVPKPVRHRCPECVAKRANPNAPAESPATRLSAQMNLSGGRS